MSYNTPALSVVTQCFVGFRQRQETVYLFPMKTFGLFKQGESEPTQTFEGEIIVKFGRDVVVFGQPRKDNIRRVVAIITVPRDQVVREVKPK
jgi:hypothetical protein